MTYTALSGKLQGEYQRIFDEVEAYVMIKEYIGDEKEEMMMNLLDLLLSAQEDGKDPVKIVGEDIPAFCREYFSMYDRRANRWERIWNMVILWAVFALANCALDLAFAGKKLLKQPWQLTTDMTSLICCIGVALVGSGILSLILNSVYRGKTVRTQKITRIIMIMAFVFAGAGVMLQEFLKPKIILPLWPVVGIHVVLVILYGIMKRRRNYRKYGSARRPKEVKEAEKLLYVDAHTDDITTDFERQMVEEFARAYDKKNRKRAKKKLAPMTPEEYTDFLAKENHKIERIIHWIPVCYLGLILCTVVAVAVTSGFEGVLDMIAFACLIAAILFSFFYLFFIRFMSRKLLRARKVLLDKCSRSNKTILDFAYREEM